MKMLAKKSVAATVLTACILGLVTCPFLYIAIGAPLQFAPAFSFIVLPPFLIGSGFLLWRYLPRSPTFGTSMPLLVAEVLSWAAIGIFLFLVSGFTLIQTAQRIGLAAMFFLLTSLLCLPLVIWRETALEARIERLPRTVSALALLVLLAAAGSAIAAYFLVPVHLI
jgi:hypothetical protein